MVRHGGYNLDMQMVLERAVYLAFTGTVGGCAGGSSWNVSSDDGREYDAETGLYNFRARMYSPELGRFLQPDPIGFKGSKWNLYRYCRNNPATLVDPMGLCDDEPNSTDPESSGDGLDGLEEFNWGDSALEIVEDSMNQIDSMLEDAMWGGPYAGEGSNSTGGSADNVPGMFGSATTFLGAAWTTLTQSINVGVDAITGDFKGIYGALGKNVFRGNGAVEMSGAIANNGGKVVPLVGAALSAASFGFDVAQYNAGTLEGGGARLAASLVINGASAVPIPQVSVPGTVLSVANAVVGDRVVRAIRSGAAEASSIINSTTSLINNIYETGSPFRWSNW